MVHVHGNWKEIYLILKFVCRLITYLHSKENIIRFSVLHYSYPMSNINGYTPRISIFNENRVLLHECVPCNKGKVENNLKHLIESFKTVQREANIFLTKLVEEAKNPQITSNENTDEAEAEDDDDDDNEDENGKVDNFHPKRQKRE